MVEEITFQPRHISVHKDPFHISVDKRLCNLLDTVIFFVYTMKTISILSISSIMRDPLYRKLAVKIPILDNTSLNKGVSF